MISADANEKKTCALPGVYASTIEKELGFNQNLNRALKDTPQEILGWLSIRNRIESIQRSFYILVNSRKVDCSSVEEAAALKCGTRFARERELGQLETASDDGATAPNIAHFAPEVWLPAVAGRFLYEMGTVSILIAHILILEYEIRPKDNGSVYSSCLVAYTFKIDEATRTSAVCNRATELELGSFWSSTNVNKMKSASSFTLGSVSLF